MAQPISKLVKELRDRLDLTQAGLASHLKVSLPTISRWESGRSEPDALALHTLEQFIRAGGKKCADLVERYFGDGRAIGAPRRRRARRTEQAPTGEPLDTRSMEGMLWRAACSIRGEKDAPKFKDYILPLIFIKRLSDVLDDEVARLIETYGDEETARSVIEADHSLVRFYIPPEAAWAVVSRRRSFPWPEDRHPKTLGEQLTATVRAIARANPSLQGVIDMVDYNETRNGEREISDEALAGLVETLSDPRYRLGLKDVEPDFLGRAYEYLLRKFAEGQGQSAGEFFTPKEVGWLIAYLMEPCQGEEVFDPCCGSGGLLVKCELALAERERPVARPLRLYGQELTGSSFAIARMNMVLHDMAGEIVRGNSMTNPKFLGGSGLRQFDIVVTNPMWNQDNFDPAAYESDPYERFGPRGGYAPSSSADWAWLQHVLASLKPAGRAAVVLDTGAASRGSGSQGENREKTIRRWFVEQDVVEGVILLPDNLFYNTTAAGIIVVLNRAKPAERRGKVLLVNASSKFQKGRPKNFLPDEAVRKIAAAFRAGHDVERLVKVVTTQEIAAADFNLSPSRYVETAAPTEHRDIQAILDELAGLDAEAARLDADLKRIFSGLGYRWEGTQ
ncbi:MAG: XRE family transcriptional regulator [Candidatus Rokubacteria bacterium RBG_16_73_20]|nr:MAG: XRE family transcriptional regulator [Candidatus Rokubacteria bacterium GWA2_73_35]OGK86386.1 MAG: XRE family transcriptional regulator [Candidatus Rokubacteria bacterium GWC2_70_16]OGK93188.1 MAG: XRE family transcriptional regulator [Candidatus Rokubacteria bacterium RBG_16_73_20]HBH02701.1 XRE family transcriptional regulator [Candidatus Rokubacteria bacterium]